jgi:Uma2 family endonuclease
MQLPIQKHLFTVQEFHAMPEVFTEDDRVELIEGEIIEMVAVGNRHMFFVNQLTDLLVPQVHSLATVSVQNPVRLGDLSEPQPDLVILRGRPRDYRHKSATAPDVLLLIEVADSSFRYDKQIKVPLYARYGIIETWLFDLERQIVEVYREPQTSGYAQLQTVNATDKLSAQALKTIEVDLREFFIE